MKKPFIILLLPIIATFGIGPVSTYAAYTITQLTNDSGYTGDVGPQINANGDVVWCRSGASGCEIMLYDGTTTTQITNNTYPDEVPQINDNGHLVWRGNGNLDPGDPTTDYEIFLYDGSTITQITDNAYSDWEPQINASGYVVWYGSDGADEEIFLYDGSTITQITDNDYNDYVTQINDNGYVVWYGEGNLDPEDPTIDSEIFLYDGSTITQITSNDYNDLAPQINNNGYVTWHGGYDDYDREIFLYDGVTTTQLTNNAYRDYFPKINDNGYVVWRAYDHIDHMLFLYDGTTTTQIDTAPGGSEHQDINADGHVVWREHGRGGSGGDSGYEIMLYDGTTLTWISHNHYPDYYPQISDNGDVVWTGRGNLDHGHPSTDNEIFLARPAPEPEIAEFVPTHGVYGTKIKVKGVGFGNERSGMIDEQNGYYSFIALSVLQASYGYGANLDATMIFTIYTHWSDDKVKVKFKKIFVDDDGDYLQDDDEPFLTMDDFDVPSYSPSALFGLWVNTAKFHDLNGNDSYDEGDEIYEIVVSSLQTFTLTEEPVIYKLVPFSTPPTQPGIPQKVKIKGLNFGDTQGSSILHIGGRSWDRTSPKIKIWEDEKIKFEVPAYPQPFPKTKPVWVTVKGQDSNKVMLEITAP